MQEMEKAFAITMKVSIEIETFSIYNPLRVDTRKEYTKGIILCPEKAK